MTVHVDICGRKLEVLYKNVLAKNLCKMSYFFLETKRKTIVIVPIVKVNSIIRLFLFLHLQCPSIEYEYEIGKR